MKMTTQKNIKIPQKKPIVRDSYIRDMLDDFFLSSDRMMTITPDNEKEYNSIGTALRNYSRGANGHRFFPIFVTARNGIIYVIKEDE